MADRSGGPRVTQVFSTPLADFWPCDGAELVDWAELVV